MLLDGNGFDTGFDAGYGYDALTRLGLYGGPRPPWGDLSKPAGGAMTDIYLGGAALSKIYIGSTEVSKVYVGTTQVWGS